MSALRGTVGDGLANHLKIKKAGLFCLHNLLSLVAVAASLAYDIKTLTSASAHDNGTTNESALDQRWANEGKSGPRSWSKIAGKRMIRKHHY